VRQEVPASRPRDILWPKGNEEIGKHRVHWEWNYAKLHVMRSFFLSVSFFFNYMMCPSFWIGNSLAATCFATNKEEQGQSLPEQQHK
jgi:hypothetical protein